MVAVDLHYAQGLADLAIDVNIDMIWKNRDTHQIMRRSPPVNRLKIKRHRTKNLSSGKRVLPQKAIVREHHESAREVLCPRRTRPTVLFPDECLSQSHDDQEMYEPQTVRVIGVTWVVVEPVDLGHEARLVE